MIIIIISGVIITLGLRLDLKERAAMRLSIAAAKVVASLVAPAFQHAWS